MRIVELNGFNARCEAKGIQRSVNLFLLQHEQLQSGDLVMVHVGNAIQKMTEEEASSAWNLYDEMLSLDDAQDGHA
jgi:hydrogenase expression/formation protein HypC